MKKVFKILHTHYYLFMCMLWAFFLGRDLMLNPGIIVLATNLVVISVFLYFYFRTYKSANREKDFELHRLQTENARLRDIQNSLHEMNAALGRDLTNLRIGQLQENDEVIVNGLKNQEPKKIKMNDSEIICL